MKLLFALDRLMARAEGFLLVLILIVMLCFATLQVILRNFFDTGIEWGDVFARHLVLWIGFFGATLSSKEGKHIRIDALTKIFPKRITPVIEMFVSVFCIVVGVLLTAAANKFMQDERGSGSILFLNVPTWYFITIMPLGFAIITFRYFVMLMEQLSAFGPQSKSSPKEHKPFEISVNIKIP